MPPHERGSCGAGSTSLHRDNSLPKVPGFCPDAASVNAYLLYCRPLASTKRAVPRLKFQENSQNKFENITLLDNFAKTISK
jgi:hypothetical protein